MDYLVKSLGTIQTKSRDERRRTLLDILLVIVTAATIAGLLYAISLDAGNRVSEQVVLSLYHAVTMFAVGIPLTFVISRRWSNLAASLVFVIMVLFDILLNPGQETLWENIYLFLVIPILMSSFLIYPWAGFLVAGFIDLWIVLTPNDVGSPLNVTAVVGYLVIAGVSWLSARNLEHALDQLYTANRELDRRIQQQQQAETVLRQRNQQLSLLNRAGQAFSSTIELDEVLANILGEVRQSFNAVAWSIWLVDQTTQELVCHLVEGPKKERVQNIRAAPGQGIAGWTALHKESVLIADAALDPRIVREENTPRFDMRSVLSVPMVRKDVVIGVIQVLDFKPNLFTHNDLELLELLAASAAAAIENAQLYNAAQNEIAERKRAEAALRESEARYRTLVETSPDSIITYEQNGTILMANPKAASLYGFHSTEEMIGKNALDFTAQEDVPKAVEMMRQIVGWRTPHTFEFNQVRPDGTCFPVEASVVALSNKPGQPSTFISVMRDITARKRAERAAENRHRRIVAHNRIVTLLNQQHNLDELLTETLDATLEIIGVDTGWLQLFPVPGSKNAPPALKTMSSCPATPPDGLLPTPLTTQLIQQAQEQGHAILQKDLTATFRNPADGKLKRLTFPAVVLPIKSRDRMEGILGILGIAGCHARSISERQVELLTTISYQIGTAVENIRLVQQAAEIEALRDLDNLRAELIANFSHDLRTPLGLIKMSCNTLMRQDVEFDSETRTACLEDIETQVDMLTEIVDNVLDLARIESGRLRLKKHPFDLRMLAQKILDTAQPRTTKHTITLNFPSTPLIVEADQQHIAAVFRNLLDNAIKYSKRGTTITISGQQKDGHVLVQVKDQGFGIPPEAQEKIFERFYRVNNRATKHIRGVGLGLAVCRGIIRAHNGEIWVDSVPGKGSTFSFSLPAPYPTSCSKPNR